MAKKSTVTDFPEPEVDQEAPANADFDLEDEYKPEPLLAKGRYTGNTTSIKRDGVVVAWQITLAGNDGVMSDGETPIDGSVHYFRNYLPKEGDDKEYTKDGRQTKRQFKINQTKRFADDMSINMNSLNVIDAAIDGGHWLGIEVLVDIEPEEYLGVTRNRVQKMVAQKVD